MNDSFYKGAYVEQGHFSNWNLRRINISEMVLYSIILLSNISQLPFFVKSGTTHYISYPIWAVSLLLIICKNKLYFNSRLKMIVGFSVILTIMMVVLSIVSIEKEYLTSPTLYSFYITVLCFFLGVQLGANVKYEVLKKGLICYVSSTMIVSVATFFQYFGIGYDVAVKSYSYSSKNSLGFLVLTTILILILEIKPKTKPLRFIRILSIVFEIYFLAILRARAILVALILSLLIIFFSNNIRLVHKVFLLFGGIIASFIVLMSDTFIQKIGIIFTNQLVGENFIKSILNEGMYSKQLYTLTSGRNLIIAEFQNLFNGHELLGVGGLYYECFPLSVILQFGIGVGLMFIIFSCMPFFCSIKKRNRFKTWFLLFLLSVSYLFDGLTDGLAPLGPGIRCYFLWLLWGILEGLEKKTYDNHQCNKKI